ncbi:hypothetical protein RRG08_025155 [Elysia crispata]|uniref:Uncharacterized protein n=1 Tax=Elysia crispata TaxID=231223 RepID=A0AAE0YCE4_9GAST|nr:hypothetical protein RRG08_025155 [Elysia crispata]
MRRCSVDSPTDKFLSCRVNTCITERMFETLQDYGYNTIKKAHKVVDQRGAATHHLPGRASKVRHHLQALSGARLNP